jgi:hypothetical protein
MAGALRAELSGHGRSSHESAALDTLRQRMAGLTVVRHDHAGGRRPHADLRPRSGMVVRAHARSHRVRRSRRSGRLAGAYPGEGGDDRHPGLAGQSVRRTSGGAGGGANPSGGRARRTAHRFGRRGRRIAAGGCPSSDGLRRARLHHVGCGVHDRRPDDPGRAQHQPRPTARRRRGWRGWPSVLALSRWCETCSLVCSF